MTEKNEQKVGEWIVYRPDGTEACREPSMARALARIEGTYKLTVEGILGLEHAGWRVLPSTTPPLDALRALEKGWREDVECGTGYLNDESDRAVLSCADDLAAAIKAMGGEGG